MNIPPLNIVDLAKSFETGDGSLDDYLERLRLFFEAREPSVASFIPEAGRFDRLRREAAELMARYPDRKTRPPLFGVLVGVKDIFHVAGFTTHAGSKLPPEELQGPEAESVTWLKNAGALIMGKTVTTEFAYFAPGLTRNPHNPEHTPGGSSSGSAAAVGAGLCPLTLGTQTIGSIVRPASFCGVFGYKPSYGRVSREGVIPLSPSFDHVGLFAATLNGVAHVAGVLCKDWQEIPYRQRLPVIGIPEGPYLRCAGQEMVDHFRRICRNLEKARYMIKPISVMPDFEAIRERHYALTAGEAFRVHQRWFPRYRYLYHPKTVELLERGQGIPDETLNKAVEGRKQLGTELTQLMDVEGIDVWLSPSAIGPAPKGLDSTGDPVMNLPWTQAGFPALNLPSGISPDGLPLGLQVSARYNHDEALLAWADSINSSLTIR